MGEDRDDAVALGLVLEIGLMTTEELARSLDWPGWRAADAVGRLCRAGLVHYGDLVTPSRAARRAVALGV